MMKVMNSYNPILITLYTATWTAGMAAMMFPAIIPMVLLYNKLISNNQSDSSQEIVELKFPYSFQVNSFCWYVFCRLGGNRYCFTLGWSVPMNIIVSMPTNNNIGIIFGSILIISGIYQFTPLKHKCIGYCESPLSFFMRRWKSGMSGAIKMGAYHGLIALDVAGHIFLLWLLLDG
jgi:predicted metal-binding membrane protein